jgi:hypothetical protein
MDIWKQLKSTYKTHLIFIAVTKVIKGFDGIKAFLLKSLLYNHSKKDTNGLYIINL